MNDTTTVTVQTAATEQTFVFRHSVTYLAWSYWKQAQRIRRAFRESRAVARNESAYRVVIDY